MASLFEQVPDYQHAAVEVTHQTGTDWACVLVLQFRGRRVERFPVSAIPDDLLLTAVDDAAILVKRAIYWNGDQVLNSARAWHRTWKEKAELAKS